mgnify:CR=1 FL=1
MRNLMQQEADALAAADFSENALMLFATVRQGFGQWLVHDTWGMWYGNRGVLLVMTETELTIIDHLSKPTPEITRIPLNETTAWSLSAQLNYFLLTLTYQGTVQRFGIITGQDLLIDDGRTPRNLERLIQNGFFGHLPHNPQG